MGSQGMVDNRNTVDIHSNSPGMAGTHRNKEPMVEDMAVGMVAAMEQRHPGDMAVVGLGWAAQLR